jgi:hypothetical protein
MYGTVSRSTTAGRRYSTWIMAIARQPTLLDVRRERAAAAATPVWLEECRNATERSSIFITEREDLARIRVRSLVMARLFTASSRRLLGSAWKAG